MAEYRFSQGAANHYYGQYNQQPQQPQPHHPRHQLARNVTPPNTLRAAFETPSPTRSPKSPAYGMFSQGHQGQHGRVNGGAGRGMTMMYNYQHQNSHQPQHTQHHPNLQQEHSGPHTNGIGHHSTFPSGVLSNNAPSFTPNNLQSGQAATTRGGQAQQITEHWAEQLTQHKEAQKIHQAMIEQGAPNHFARVKAGENKGLSTNANAVEARNDPDDEKDPARMAETLTVKRRQDWANLDLSGQGLRIITPPLFNFDFLTELYISSNKLTSLPPAIGKLRMLRHLDASNNSLTELPVELGLCVKLKTLLLFDNRITTLPYELGSLFKLEMLGIEGNADFDQDLRQEIMEKGTIALITHLREAAPIPPPPSKPREILELQESSASANQDKFKVLSWNILAGGTCTTTMYGYAPSVALSWEHRSQKILDEISVNDADVVCLQEVEKDVFDEFLSVQLAYKGYRGVFWSRTRAKTMSARDVKNVDGCATFYKHAKLILLDKSGIEFAHVAINRPDMKMQKDMFNRFMPRDHIGLLTFFENRYTGSRVLVGNTHIFWDPAYADVKLIQVAIFMQSIDKAAEKYAKWPAQTNKKAFTMLDNEQKDEAEEPLPEPAPSKTYNSKTVLPMVLCTDLNSTVDSGVYELLSKGSVAPEHKELRGFEYGDFSKYGIEHPFSIRSAYTHLDKGPDAMPFTNYTTDFRGVIDHVWYSTNSLENIALLGRIDPDYMSTVPGFPNYHFPSDHIALMAEFAFKGKKEKKVHAEPDFGTSSRRDRRD